MSDVDELLAVIQRRLPQDERKPSLVRHIELVWDRRLRADRGHGLLIVTTARELTTDGGDGWTGLDGKDLDILDTAISEAIDEVGATGMIDRFIVRVEAKKTSLTDDEIDALFD